MRMIYLAVFMLTACGGGRDALPGSAPDSESPAMTKAPGRVLIIGMDGTRAEALDVASTPYLDLLRSVGTADMDALTGDVSLSGPGWASMLTGVWCDKHRVIDNDVSWAQSRFDLYPHVFRRLHAQTPDASTLSVSHWAAINDEILCADEHGDSCENSGDVVTVATDAAVRDSVVEALTNGDPQAIFLQFDDNDHAGHGDPASADPGGFCPFAGGDLSEGEEGGVCTALNYNPHYVETIELTDGYIGDILTALYARPRFAAENWLILVSPDHGGGGAVFNQHGFPVAQDRRTFLIMAGAAVDTLPDSPVHIVDIAATALFHLGVSAEEIAELDGQPVGLAGAPAYAAREIPSCYDPAIFLP